MPARLSNVLAVYVESASERAACERDLRASFPSVRALSSGWLVAERALPESPPSRAHDPALAIWEGEAELAAAPLAREPIDGMVERLSRIDGEVGFARLEPNGRFLALRSAGGWVPLYVAVDRGAAWLATSLEDLARHRSDEPRPDALVQALWSEGNAVFPDRRTFFEGVECVPRGHAVTGALEARRLVPYWDPRPERLDTPSEATAREHAEELRRALVDTLEGSLSREGPNLLTLSGGVDSSSLACLARGLGFSLATLTFVAPRRSPARAAQLSYVEPLLRELGVSAAKLVDADDDFLEALFQRALPALFFCPHPALRLLPALAPELGPRALFSGHFADEITGYSQRLQDWIRHTPLRRVLDPRYPHPSGLRDVARWVKRRGLERLGRPLLPFPGEVGPWFHDDVRGEVAEWARRERRRALEDPRPLRELAAWCRLDGWLAMQWECCSRWGIRPSTPFFTRRMLELAFRCHPSELFGPGTKKILRRGLRGLVPDRYLDRPDKGHWRVTRRPPLTDPRAGLPDEIRGFLQNEYPVPGAPLTALEDRALNQLVLFSRKVREVRHAGNGRDDTAPPRAHAQEGGVRGARNP